MFSINCHQSRRRAIASRYPHRRRDQSEYVQLPSAPPMSGAAGKDFSLINDFHHVESLVALRDKTLR